MDCKGTTILEKKGKNQHFLIVKYLGKYHFVTYFGFKCVILITFTLYFISFCCKTSFNKKFFKKNPLSPPRGEERGQSG